MRQECGSCENSELQLYKLSRSRSQPVHVHLAAADAAAAQSGATAGSAQKPQLIWRQNSEASQFCLESSSNQASSGKAAAAITAMMNPSGMRDSGLACGKWPARISQGVPREGGRGGEGGRDLGPVHSRLGGPIGMGPTYRRSAAAGSHVQHQQCSSSSSSSRHHQKAKPESHLPLHGSTACRAPRAALHRRAAAVRQQQRAGCGLEGRRPVAVVGWGPGLALHQHPQQAAREGGVAGNTSEQLAGCLVQARPRPAAPAVCA